MKHILGALRRTSFGTVAALFLLTVVGVALPARDASAAGLQYRSLQLSSTQGGDQPAIGSGGEAAPAGSAANGTEVSHTYIFRVPTAGEIEALQFQYCDNAFGYIEFLPDDAGSVCGTIAGFTSAGAGTATVYKDDVLADVIAADTGGTAYTRNATDSTANNLIVENASGITATANDYIKVVFDAANGGVFKNPNLGWTNPAGDKTFFAHIETYDTVADVDSGAHVDEGTVTSSAANLVTIETRVQETLKFSVGGHGGSADTTLGAANDPTGACVAVDTDPELDAGVFTEGELTMGDNNRALSTQASSTTKAFARLATNSARGAKVMYAGQTLKSTAGDEITAIGTTAAPAATPGSAAQFGLAVLAPNAGAFEDYSDLAPAGQYDFDTTGGYAFDEDSNTAPVILAQSASSVGCDTLPIEYVANISNETPAGLYSTRVSLIAVPSY